MSARKIKPQSGKPELAETAEKRKVLSSKKEKKGAAEPEGLEERLQAAETQAEENHDRLLRVMAEFENYKKRMDREMNDYRKFANESLIKEILPIVDSLEKALESSGEQNEKALGSLREGVGMTLKGLLTGLEKFGVVPVESLEQPFDPNFHQAVMQEESAGHSDNMVVQELQKGYLIGDRLLRPAMVVVSKKPNSKPEVKSEDPEDAYKIDVTIQ
ncbi:MAG: nucleotide exchange factor GrpE [Deltaproteobacteria bacterium]|nr:nucleotide exchange factor GrpE [Deltaproteobacteria bacterium]MBW2170626.1 nucleotide exchange factor GrpE [Deltaproteobacteria bacterium]